MRIQHNIMAMSAYRNYTNNVSAMKKNLEKLSSGYKINRAGDDAAGLAISEKMRAQITGLETAQKNAKDGISLVQTAEGALTEVHDMLNRMVELATQSANGTYDNNVDRAQMQKEVDQLREEIDRIADSSNFNGIKLLDGSMGLNDKAVTNIKFLAAADVVKGGALASAAKVNATTDIHGAKTTTFKKPSFDISLGDMEVKAATSTATSVTVTINVANKTLTVTSLALDTTGGKVTATAIANAFQTKYTAASATATATGAGVDIGGALYKVTANGSKLTFTLEGVKNAASSAVDVITSSTNTDLFTSAMASAFNAAVAPGATVTVSAASGGTIDAANQQKYIHGVIKKDEAQAEGGIRWGAKVTQDAASLMQDGNKLTIGVATENGGDTRTFTIKISATATKSALSGDTVTISTKEVGTTATAQMKKLNQLLEGQTAGLFTLSVKNGNELHIDVTPGQDDKTTSWTKDTLMGAGAVKVQAADTPAHNKGVEFNVDTSKLNKGDVITVGEKSFVYQGKDTNTAFEDADGLKSKLATAFGTNNVKVDGNKFTVYASTASAAAPSVLGKGLTLQIGDTADDFNQLNVKLKDMHVDALGIDDSVMSISNQEDAAKAVDMIKDAINKVSDLRGTLGATQNRLDHTINNLSVMTENIQDAESTIRDVDVAEEMMAYTKNNILIQSAQAMLAQANQVPQGVLQLLQ